MVHDERDDPLWVEFPEPRDGDRQWAIVYLLAALAVLALAVLTW
jgi:hypothetical protein